MDEKFSELRAEFGVEGEANKLSFEEFCALSNSDVEGLLQRVASLKSR